MTLTDPMRDRFADLFGGVPTGVWAAPGRVNLIGEHTDYNDGFMMPLAIARGVVALARPNTDRVVRAASMQDPARLEIGLDRLEPGAVDGWAAYVAGVVWSLRTMRNVSSDPATAIGGLDILVSGDVPQGSGLSSSAALECATGLALVDMFGLDVDRPTLARLAQRAENDFVGMPCGILDQSASLLCTKDHVLFLDARTLDTESVPFDLGAEGLGLMVIDTRAPHRHVDGEYARRRRDCETAAARLGVPALRDVEDLDRALAELDDPVLRGRVRHVVTENDRVRRTVAELRNGSPRTIGDLMTASHASLRDDYQVTVPELDTAVDAALDAGALGARMTGGGFGGCVIALVEADAVDAVTEKVEAAFAGRGFTPPGAFVATASSGGRRLA